MRELVMIKLGGKDHPLRPTWEAYGEIEARCGALMALYKRVGFGGATLDELAAIVTAGMRAAGSADGRAISEKAVAQRLYEAGPWADETLQPIMQFLEALGWTPEQRKKIEAKARELAKTTNSDPLAEYMQQQQPNTV